MKQLRIIKLFVISINVLLLFWYLLTINYKIKLIILCISLFLSFLLALIIYKKTKIKLIRILHYRIKLTFGLPLVLCSLPILFSIIQNLDLPFHSAMLIIYVLVLLLSIFNFGININSNIIDS